MRRRTIGAEGCHVRVRDGIGCLPLAMTTRPAKYAKSEHDGVLWPSSSGRRPRVGAVAIAAARDVGDLFKPIERLGPVSSTHCLASTHGLSPWRSEGRSGGTEWDSKLRYWWWAGH